jgi:hypothetical protein
VVDACVIALSDKVMHSANQVAVELEGDVVLMSIEQGKYFNLNEIASDIWKRLNQPVKVGSLCDALATEFSAPIDTVRADVLALLQHFHREKLIEITA